MDFKTFPLWARCAAYLLLLAFLITILFPFAWMVLTSFKTLADYANNPFGLPTSFV